MVSSLLSLSPLSELTGASVVSPNRHLRVPDDTRFKQIQVPLFIYLLYFNHDTFFEKL